MPLVKLLAALLMVALEAGAGQPLLKTDFASDPQAQGWQYTGRTARPWAEGAVLGKPCLTVQGGNWRSPKIAVEQFKFYRLRYQVNAPKGGGYVAAEFYDAAGTRLIADVYDSIDASASWGSQELVVKARASATAMTLFFESRRTPVYLTDLVVEEITRAEAAQAADALYATLPPLVYKPDPLRWKLIPQTMATLQQGGPLKVVMFGDSIVNDTGNSNWDTLVERLYPGAQVEAITSVRGGGGCEGYLRDQLVKSYVLDLQPDLVMIGGISTHKPEAVREVVRQIRAGSKAEILIFSPTMEEYGRANPSAAFKRDANKFFDDLRKVALQEKVEFLDMTTPWIRYATTCPKGIDWLHRDDIHANDRGKQVLGRILLGYFSPKTEASSTPKVPATQRSAPATNAAPRSGILP